LIDTAVTAVVFIALMIVASLADNVPHTGGVFVTLIVGWLFLYEPIQVWLFGATIGHRGANIRVVSDKTGGPPSFLVSFARFFVKSFLGFPSFVSMAFTRRHQSVHDYVTRTTVQLRDLSIASDDDYLLERVPDTVTIAIPATTSRRITVTLLYIVVAYLLSSLAGVGLVSDQCLSQSECSSADAANSRLVTYLLLAAIVAIAVQGWRGRLWGARSHIETAPLAAAPDKTDPPAV
jgi:hypothetical protein